MSVDMYMKNNLIQVTTKINLECAIDYLNKSGFLISDERKKQFIESWDSIDAVYGDMFSKTISALINRKEDMI